MRGHVDCLGEPLDLVVVDQIVAVHVQGLERPVHFAFAERAEPKRLRQSFRDLQTELRAQNSVAPDRLEQQRCQARNHVRRRAGSNRRSLTIVSIAHVGSVRQLRSVDEKMAEGILLPP
eukprot:2914770-Rhodomonas_salina.1